MSIIGEDLILEIEVQRARRGGSKWRIWKNGVGIAAWCLTTGVGTYQGFSSFDSVVQFAEEIASPYERVQ